MLGHFIAVSLLIVVHICEGAERCVCNQIRHPQHEFCESDFAFHVRIVAGKSSPLPHEEDIGEIYNTHLKYAVEILETFKGVQYNMRGSLAVFYTPKKGLCGETQLFQNGDNEYLLTGDFSQTSRGHLYNAITTCNWIENWDSIPEDQRTGLRGIYGENCDCVVAPVSGQILSGDNPEDRFRVEDCFYNPLSALVLKVTDCETNNGLCTKHTDDSCSWQNDGNYAECYGIRRNKLTTESAAITNKSQCKTFTGRKRKRCNKKFRN